VDLKHLQGLLDQVAKVGCLSLRVVNLVADVSVADLEQVEDGEDLAVVGNEGLTDGVRAGHEGLQDLQGDRDDLNVTGVQGDLDGDDELGDDGKDLSTTLLKHVEDTLDGEESVRILLLTDALEENG